MTAHGALAAALTAALAACSSSAQSPRAASTLAPTVSMPAAPRTVEIVGTMTLTDINGWAARHGVFTQDSPCHAVDGYRDIRAGAQVVISDDASRTLAIAGLGRGRIDAGERCQFPFRAHVPAGRHFYGIEVTHRGVVKEPERDLGHVALTLG